MDDRLIVALDVPNALAGLALAERIGDAVGFYKIGLGMLTGGGLALANELKQEHGKRIFLDMKFFDIGATVEAAVRGAQEAFGCMIELAGHSRRQLSVTV
jgi:orotidine-5'-phosphate decarboxylase